MAGKCQILLLFHFFQGLQAINLEAVLVPQSKFRGQNATLLCKYELEQNEELFSLKWYKEETEFYRYTPPDPLAPAHQIQQSYSKYRDGRNSQDDENQDDDYDEDKWKKGKGSGSRFWYDQSHVSDDYNPYRKNNQPYNGNKHQRPTTPPGLVQTWKVPGIRIDEDASTPQRVVLKKVGFKSTGMYRCEVTAVVRHRGISGYQGIQEFVMKESINRMTVVELPPPGSYPIITGGDMTADLDRATNPFYKPGDILNLTCTSAPSNPPASLEWRINGKEVSNEFVVRQHLRQEGRGLFSSVIGLVLKLRDEHFSEGQLRVQCRGTIEAEFWKKDVENVFNDKDSFVKVLEIKESQWPDSSSQTVISYGLIFATLTISLRFCFDNF